MSVLKSIKGASLMLSSAAVVAAGATVAYVNTAATAKADFSLSISPASKSVSQGQAASFSVSLNQVNGFKDAVALTASNLPSGTSASFSPSIVDKPSSPASLVLSVAANGATGTFSNIQITGTGGGQSHTYPLQLVIGAAQPAGFSLSTTTSSATVLPGGTAAYNVAINRPSFNGSVALAVNAGLPSNSTASFTPASTTGSTSQLQVVTKNNTPTGTYTLVVSGTATGQQTQSLSLTLNVSGTGKDFTISAPTPADLVPGASQPLNLTITNTNNQPMLVTNLSVAVQSVVKNSAYAAGTCTTGDFGVTQLDPSVYPISVGAGQTVTLTGIGVADAMRPHVAMLNRADINQNACVGASYVLSLTGAANG